MYVWNRIKLSQWKWKKRPIWLIRLAAISTHSKNYVHAKCETRVRRPKNVSFWIIANLFQHFSFCFCHWVFLSFFLNPKVNEPSFWLNIILMLKIYMSSASKFGIIQHKHKLTSTIHRNCFHSLRLWCNLCDKQTSKTKAKQKNTFKKMEQKTYWMVLRL